MVKKERSEILRAAEGTASEDRETGKELEEHAAGSKEGNLDGADKAGGF